MSQLQGGDDEPLEPWMAGYQEPHQRALNLLDQLRHELNQMEYHRGRGVHSTVARAANVQLVTIAGLVREHDWQTVMEPESSKVHSPQVEALRRLKASIHGEDQTDDYWRRIIRIVGSAFTDAFSRGKP